MIFNTDQVYAELYSDCIHGLWKDVKEGVDSIVWHRVWKELYGELHDQTFIRVHHTIWDKMRLLLGKFDDN